MYCHTEPIYVVFALLVEKPKQQPASLFCGSRRFSISEIGRLGSYTCLTEIRSYENNGSLDWLNALGVSSGILVFRRLISGEVIHQINYPVAPCDRSRANARFRSLEKLRREICWPAWLVVQRVSKQDWIEIPQDRDPGHPRIRSLRRPFRPKGNSRMATSAVTPAPSHHVPRDGAPGCRIQSRQSMG